jgi:hypothetical protein
MPSVTGAPLLLQSKKTAGPKDGAGATRRDAAAPAKNHDG